MGRPKKQEMKSEPQQDSTLNFDFADESSKKESPTKRTRKSASSVNDLPKVKDVIKKSQYFKIRFMFKKFKFFYKGI